MSTVQLDRSGSGRPLEDPAATYYKGTIGRHYHARRGAARSERAQANRADTLRPWVDGLSTVVDFGCGDGGVLSRLDVGQRIGIEVSEDMADRARRRGLHVVSALDALGSSIADAVIFSHSLEHLASPASTLLKVKDVLRPGGRVVILLPAESPSHRDHRTWRPNTDRHLFSWTPLTIGNLLNSCGFDLAFARLQAPVTRSRLVHSLGLTPALQRSLSAWRARFLRRMEILAVAFRPTRGASPGPGS
jgi:SAM-dependent methyltransferase